MNQISIPATRLLILILCVLSVWAGRIRAQELVTNGSFENANNTFAADGNGAMSLPVGSQMIPGWTTTNAELLWITNANVFGPTTPYGSFFLDLTGYHDSYPYGGVTQSLATSPGQTYHVSFALGEYEASGIYAGPVSALATVGAALTNIFTFTQTNGGANQWTNFQMNFTAQSAISLISLWGLMTKGGQYIGLDNISLTATGGGPQLLANGSLEDINGAFVNQSEGAMSLPVRSTTIAGWTTIAAEIAWVTNSTPLGLLTPYGSMFLDLTGFHDSVPYGGIEQAVATILGQTYTLSFAVGVDQAAAGYSGPVAVEAMVQSGAEYSTTAAGGDWQTFSFNFVATASATPLSIVGSSATGGQYLGLDDVSVTPGSGMSLLVITGIQPSARTNLLLNFNSALGHSYAVQSSASLASGTWVTVPGTTNAGTGSSITVPLTNAVNSAQQYFRISQIQ